MSTPDDRRYTKEHEWARLEEDGTVLVGLTDFAQDQLGDIVFVELPEVGAAVGSDEPFGVVESVKSVSDLFAPISGTIESVNDELLENPALANNDPYDAGWLVVMSIAENVTLDELMTAADYDDYAAT